MPASVGYGLILIFAAVPWVTVQGKPLVLLDLPRREFTFFGKTFFATDTLVLMLFLLGVFALVFALTAWLGRVWCGWACPQTVYLELVFRPLEHWIQGPTHGRESVAFPRRIALAVANLVVALLLAHVFLAWFVPTRELWSWTLGSPFDHATSFVVMLVTTGLILFDFGWFREQMCTLACPYGRLQSVLLDRSSLVVGYDAARGEPRGKVKKDSVEGAPVGDCVDCKACVVTCPTGIDIRKGLQMECIACTQCVDACDTIMTRLDRPTGLIRYMTADAATGKTAPGRRLRFRPFLYGAVVLATTTALVIVASGKGGADVRVLRDKDAPFQVLDGGMVSNSLRVKIRNRSASVETYSVTVPGVAEIRLASPDLPLTVAPGESRTASLIVLAPATEIQGGARDITVVVSDGHGPVDSVPYRLLGPANAREVDTP